ncbi:hypothetical protein GCM10010517_29130 [Streptosporangium fragile]|uniref:Uncharacterized protein n=1 Tax=Streptosporangium fragile TaxID=46186 RepID=A0ABN3VX56_9ACTN
MFRGGAVVIATGLTPTPAAEVTIAEGDPEQAPLRRAVPRGGGEQPPARLRAGERPSIHKEKPNEPE